MATLLFSFRNDGKAVTGRFKAFRPGGNHDVRQIIIKKVPHRMKQFTEYFFLVKGLQETLFTSSKQIEKERDPSSSSLVRR